MRDDRDTLTIPEIREHLARFSFPPGWRFEVLDPGRPFGEVITFPGLPIPVRLIMPVVNTYPPHEVTEVSLVGALPAPRGIADLARAVRRIVHEAVLHEADEWIEIDGVKVFDPHASEDALRARLAGAERRHPAGLGEYARLRRSYPAESAHRAVIRAASMLLRDELPRSPGPMRHPCVVADYFDESGGEWIDERNPYPQPADPAAVLADVVKVAERAQRTRGRERELPRTELIDLPDTDLAAGGSVRAGTIRVLPLDADGEPYDPAMPGRGGG